MKRRLPFIVAAAALVGVAVYLLIPGPRPPGPLADSLRTARGVVSVV
jgi:hypothetical protein